MRNPAPLEDIEERRRENGIEDVELRIQIRSLKVGDLVNLTLISPTAIGETVRVRLTRIQDGHFRGKLVQKASCAGLANIKLGTSIEFAAAHIHSLGRS